MTAFIIKLVACLSMLIDHINNVFGNFGWAFLPQGLSTVMGYAGRLAFPLFAYMIVNGYMHTSNKRKYFSNMLLFATIAQIPYTLALYLVNLSPIEQSESMNIFMKPWLYIAIPIIIIVIYVFTIWRKKKDISIIWLIAASVFPGLYLKINGIWLTVGESLNIFYTLALGIAAIYIIQSILERKDGFSWVKWSMLVAAYIGALLFIGMNADYGLVGIALIVMFYLARNRKIMQTVTLAAWSFLLYGLVVFNIPNAIASCFALPFILLYNGKKGYSMKYAFYAFYPAHLIALGIFNIVQRLS